MSTVRTNADNVDQIALMQAIRALYRSECRLMLRSSCIALGVKIARNWNFNLHSFEILPERGYVSVSVYLIRHCMLWSAWVHHLIFFGFGYKTIEELL